MLVDAEMSRSKQTDVTNSDRPGHSPAAATDSALVDTTKDGSAPSVKPKTSTTPAPRDPGLHAMQLATSLRSLSPQARAGRLDELIAVIVSAFQVRSEKKVTKEVGRLSAPLKHTVEWILERPLALSKLERYQSFVRSVQIFAKRMPNEGSRLGFSGA